MMLIYNLPIQSAVEMAHRLVLCVLDQYVPEEDQHEVRRRLAAMLQEHRPVRKSLDWRKDLK